MAELIASFGMVGPGIFMFAIVMLSSFGLFSTVGLPVFFADRLSIAGLFGSMTTFIISISIVAVARLMGWSNSELQLPIFAAFALSLVGWLVLIWGTIFQRSKLDINS